MDASSGFPAPQEESPLSAEAPGGDYLEVATAATPVQPQQPSDLASWGSSFERAPEQAQLFLNFHRSDPEAAHDRLEVPALPEVGTELLGFRLLAELGKGAFGRVFLAQQDDLANRHVVLKVSASIDGESRILARLQHTNIVPVYSVHRAGGLQAVCMPYYGSTTLAHLLKDMVGRAALPQSGEDLVVTLLGRKSTVREGEGQSAAGPSEPGSVADLAAPAAGPTPGAEPAPGLLVLQGLSYVDAVLWIGCRLADGLAHAHERGIVHRDMKPANILLTDDGQPMLLDFNLAQDTRRTGGAARAQVGGTLPFMAPEQLEALRTETYRLNFGGDVYALGVILYELLTHRHPFQSHRGPTKQVLEAMIRERQAPPPSVRCWNKAVSPAAEAIIRRCLEPDPKRRYQTARQLQEDLDCHFDNLPLRHTPEPSLQERAVKWLRRHPSLRSSTTLTGVAAILIVCMLSLLGAHSRRLAVADARESLGRFLEDKRTVQYLLTTRTTDAGQLDAGVRLGRRLLAAFDDSDRIRWQGLRGVQHLAGADQVLLRENVGELLLLLAQGVSLQAGNQGGAPDRDRLAEEALRLNTLAESCRGTDEAPRALWMQRADLTRLLGRAAEAERLRARALATPLRTAADRYLMAADHLAQGRFTEALPLLAEATEQDPQDFWAWFLRGVCQDGLGRYAEAVGCYSTCLALTPTSPWAYFNRGLSHLRQQHYARAGADFDRALALRPDLIEAYTNRALARQGLKQYAEATSDLARALDLGAPPEYVHLLRAGVRERAGDREGARQDRAAGLRREPADEMGWLARGYARLDAEPLAALRDFDRALELNPRSLAALQNKAHILGKLGRNEEAAATLDRAVKLYPDFIRARAGRGVIRARLGDREAAHQDAEACLARDSQPQTLYQLAGIYALTSRHHADDRHRALALLSAALQKGCGFDLVETDRDLDPIRDRPEFAKLLGAARAIRATPADNRQAP
jgi:serine/threonine protein kinase/Flp pilus assembly protein TadD